MVRTVSLWPVPSLIVSSKTNLFRWLIVVSTTRPAPSVNFRAALDGDNRGAKIARQAHLYEVERKRNFRADANVVLLDPLGRLERFDVHVVTRAVVPMCHGQQDGVSSRSSD